MTEQNVEERTSHERPWPVYALVTILALGSITPFVFGYPITWGTVLGSIVNLALVVALWRGLTFAFTLTFMLVTLCIAFAATAGILAMGLFGSGLPEGSLLGFGTACVVAFLLVHPATKRFAGLRR